MPSIDYLSFLATKVYPPLDPIPLVAPKGQGAGMSEFGEKIETNEKFTESAWPPKRHDNLSVYSVINFHLWEKAGWCGVVYSHMGLGSREPPLLGFQFDNKDMAIAIFDEWISKFGKNGVNSRIRLSIIRGINPDNVHHYRVHVSQSNEAIMKSIGHSRTFINVSRLLTMEPYDSSSLNGFLEQFSKFGSFFLVPCIASQKASLPEILFNYSILCNNLYVRNASDIGENDPDIVAIRKSLAS